jgi:hypothetical protein
MSTSEKAYLQRWFSKKYGLLPSETQKVLSALEVDSTLELNHDRWREKNGLPPSSSPLSRGHLMEVVNGLLERDESVFKRRAASAKRASSLNATLHDRAAHVLDWPIEDVRSMSLQSLREHVRYVDPRLAEAISDEVSSGRHVGGGRRASGKRGTIKADMSWLGEPPPATRPSMPPGTTKG